jgi:hypothetical protein
VLGKRLEQRPLERELAIHTRLPQSHIAISGLEILRTLVISEASTFQARKLTPNLRSTKRHRHGKKLTMLRKCSLRCEEYVKVVVICLDD